MSAMADPAEPTAKKRKTALPLLLGLGLAILGGAGGFVAVWGGFLSGTATDSGSDGHTVALPAPLLPGAFVPLDPLIVNLPGQSGRQFLRFAAQLEVTPAYRAEVESIRPRIVDVLNSYIRAVEVSDLEDPGALMRLRAQMLRRVQVVAGADRVRDLLIMEFVLN